MGGPEDQDTAADLPRPIAGAGGRGERVLLDPGLQPGPAEVDALCGDPSKAREKLGWTPTVTFEELVRIMVDSDVKVLEDQLAGRNLRLS